MTLGPVVPSYGPPHAPILILAEAPGKQETRALRPLVGPSGYELRRMLQVVGVSLDDTYRANVFSRQPPANSLQAGYGTDQPNSFGPLGTKPKFYCLPDIAAAELERVACEVAAVLPHVILALGNTACWALGLGLGIGQLRGSLYTVTLPGVPRPVKVIPTYHPSAILRQFDLRTIAIADMEKARVESTHPEARYDNTEIWIEPSLTDIDTFSRLHMDSASICACDIETKRGQITCISFAPTPDVAMVIPFWVEGDHPNYWRTDGEEASAWRWVRKWMERPDLVKVFQNGLYDLQYLQAYCTPSSCSADTMIAHHSLYPELQKGLGFLGSIYANTPSWKKMRTFKKEEAFKRDD